MACRRRCRCLPAGLPAEADERLSQGLEAPLLRAGQPGHAVRTSRDPLFHALPLGPGRCGLPPARACLRANSSMAAAGGPPAACTPRLKAGRFHAPALPGMCRYYWSSKEAPRKEQAPRNTCSLLTATIKPGAEVGWEQ